MNNLFTKVHLMLHCDLLQEAKAKFNLFTIVEIHLFIEVLHFLSIIFPPCKLAKAFVVFITISIYDKLWLVE